MPLQQTSNNPFMLGDTERGDYSYAGLSPDEALVQRQIAQRRQMAKALMSRGMEQAGKRGSMVGPWYVKSSPMEGLSGMAQVGLGALGDAYFAKQSADAAEGHKKIAKDALAKYIKNTTDIAAVPGSAPLRQASVGDSNLEQIIEQANPGGSNLIPPKDVGPPQLRPMNRDKISKAMMDMQVQAPPSSEQQIFALRFGENPGNGILSQFGDGSGPRGNLTEYKSGVYTPAEEGPSMPAQPAIVRSPAERQRAALEAFALGDPMVSNAVRYIHSERDRQDQIEQQRQDRAERAEADRTLKALLVDRKIEGAKELKGTIGADAKLKTKQQASHDKSQQEMQLEKLEMQRELADLRARQPKNVRPVSVEDPNDPTRSILVDINTGKVLGGTGKRTDLGKQQDKQDAATDKARKQSSEIERILNSAEDILSGVTRDQAGNISKTSVRPTAGLAGKAADIALGTIGKSTKSGDAASQLRTLGATLTAKMPRFEGPQSDADRKYYTEMAGMIGDETKPVSQRLAAAKVVRDLYVKYSPLDRDVNSNDATGAQAAPTRRRVWDNKTMSLR